MPGVFLFYNNYHVQHDRTKTKMCSNWIPSSSWVLLPMGTMIIDAWFFFLSSTWLLILSINSYIPNMGSGKHAVCGSLSLCVVLSLYFTLRVRFQLQWRLDLQEDHHRHHPDGTLPPVSAQKPLDGNKDSKARRLPKVKGNQDRDEWRRGGMPS